MRCCTKSITVAMAAACLLFAAGIQAEETLPGKQLDYLKIVQAYADTMIERGRDTYGLQHSPLFAAALNRRRLMPGLFPDISGIRNGDRCTTAANPMHDQNLYQILYALTKITEEETYAAEADKTLTFFFENCQSPATGLLAWGEHMGWDFTDKVRGNTHEFFRPWVLWERCLQLAPDAIAVFARGLWDHQIHNQKTGEFSRHADWAGHGTGGKNEYPRHGGFYVTTWAKAYRESQEPVYSKAVETLVDMYNRLSSEQTGAIPCSSNPGRARIMWPESNLSLAVDLTDAALVFPESLRTKMLTRAESTDKVYLSLNHDFRPDGIGFVAGADIHTLATFTQGDWTHTQLWATGYGKATDAQIANLCYLRYGQLTDGPAKTGYRKLIVQCANRYLDSVPDLTRTVYPGPMGDVIFHLLAANEITGDRKYLDRADAFARFAVKSFLTEGSALPRASSQHDHYEAITRGDTMMMALLKLWQVQNKPDLSIDLIYTDR